MCSDVERDRPGRTRRRLADGTHCVLRSLHSEWSELIAKELGAPLSGSDSGAGSAVGAAYL